jgi:DNA-binding IclR family transcriptional regulator
MDEGSWCRSIAPFKPWHRWQRPRKSSNGGDKRRQAIYRRSIESAMIFAYVKAIMSKAKKRLPRKSAPAKVRMSRATVKSADRTLDLLEILASALRPISHAEISVALGIPGSSLSALLQNLTARGYATFDEARNGYALGEAVGALLERRRTGIDLATIAQPIVERVAKATGETASLDRLSNNEIERVCSANSVQTLRYWMSIGERAPAHAVSGGKAIIALLPEAARKAQLDRLDFEDITPHTITSRGVFEDVLTKIAMQGVALSEEEYEIGVIGIAVPVRDRQGLPIASLTVVIPTARANAPHRRHVHKILLAAAKSLEMQISMHVDVDPR